MILFHVYFFLRKQIFFLSLADVATFLKENEKLLKDKWANSSVKNVLARVHWYMSEILRKEKCQFFSGKIQGYFCCCGWSYFQLSSLCKTREKCTNTSLTQNSKYPSIIIAFRVKCKSFFCWCGGGCFIS